eukprot:6475852-Amphidinium_carterae.1
MQALLVPIKTLGQGQVSVIVVGEAQSMLVDHMVGAWDDKSLLEHYNEALRQLEGIWFDYDRSQIRLILKGDWVLQNRIIKAKDNKQREQIVLSALKKINALPINKGASSSHARSNSETRSNDGWSTQRRKASRSSSARRPPRQEPELDLVLDQRDWNVAIADEPRVNMNCVYLATDQGVANRAAVILAQTVADMAAVVSIEPLVSVRQSTAITFRAWNRHDPKSPEKILHGYLS